ncbi:hypothetical protein [Deinococcus hohokamensis]|uniref:Uncharacterized protein n=1 Tax=Deinococcus hohokamensis TaxID=309883 RepID=A0ABV9IF78_9DEIO
MDNVVLSDEEVRQRLEKSRALMDTCWLKMETFKSRVMECQVLAEERRWRRANGLSCQGAAYRRG